MKSQDQQFSPYENRRRDAEQKFHGNFQSWKEGLKGSIEQDEKNHDDPDPRSLIGSLSWLCRDFIADNLSAYADLLKQRSMAPSKAAEELEKYAKTLQGKVYKQKWRRGLLMRSNALQIPIDSQFSTTIWSAISEAIGDYVKQISDVLESADPGSNQKKTCCDCGFLTIQGGEASPASRLLLKAKNADLLSLCPQCFRKQWINYDLSPWADSLKKLREELATARQKCSYFVEYLPGLSPKQHLKKSIREDSAKKQPPNEPKKRDGKIRKRGRPRNENTKKRRETLHRIMHDPKELTDQKKLRTLFAALDHDKIVIPGNSNHSTRWLELLDDPGRQRELTAAISALRMDFNRQ